LIEIDFKHENLRAGADHEAHEKPKAEAASSG
jgi:hypothetical protein